MPWRVLQGAEFGSNTTSDGSRFTAILEASEIRPITPCERAAQLFACAECGVVHDVDQPLVVWRALSISGEVAQISARRENGRYPWNCCDLTCRKCSGYSEKGAGSKV